jgi:hypothetical protein
VFEAVLTRGIEPEQTCLDQLTAVVTSLNISGE